MSTTPTPDANDPRTQLQRAVESGTASPQDLAVLRIACLRRDVPDAQIATDVSHADGSRLVVRASVAFPSGARGSGLGGAVAADDDGWDAAIHTAEAEATLRALDAVGYTVTRALAQPTRQQGGQPSGQPPRQQQSQQAPPQQTQQQPTQRQQLSNRTDDPMQMVGGRRPAANAPSTATDDPLLAEYSWTSFWKTATSHGLTNERVQQMLSRPTQEMSPTEAVAELRAAGVWPDAPTQDDAS